MYAHTHTHTHDYIPKHAHKHMHTRTSQCSVVGGAEINRAYNDLLHSVEEFLVELRSRQEQQRIKDEEEEKLRKMREEEVGKICIYNHL